MNIIMNTLALEDIKKGDMVAVTVDTETGFLYMKSMGQKEKLLKGCVKFCPLNMLIEKEA